MRLVVHWVEATRPRDEVVRVESIFCGQILEFFNGVENAKKAYDICCARQKSTMSDWARAVYYSHRAVKGVISPDEYARFKYKITFEDGVSNDIPKPRR